MQLKNKDIPLLYNIRWLTIVNWGVPIIPLQIYIPKCFITTAASAEIIKCVPAGRQRDPKIRTSSLRACLKGSSKFTPGRLKFQILAFPKPSERHL